MTKPFVAVVALLALLTWSQEVAFLALRARSEEVTAPPRRREKDAARAREVLERGIEAAGGLQALQGLHAITRALEGFRVEIGQSRRPDTPYSRQPLRIRSVLDLKGGRSFEELETAVIGGLQVHALYVNRDGSSGFCSLLCLDRATGNVWGHSNPDVGEAYPPVLTTTGLCYRTSTRVYGFQRV